MLDELKNLFPANGLLVVTEILKVCQQTVAFVEQHLQDKDQVNVAIDHIKALLDSHKK